MPAVCAHPKELKGVAARRCTIRVPAGWTCNHRSRMITRILPDVVGLHTCYVHNGCVGNEVVSLCNRHLQELVEPTPEAVLGMRRFANKAMRLFDKIEPMDASIFIKQYSGPKRTRYQNAWDSLQIEPLKRSDAFLSAFIKAEKTNPFKKVNPDPRLIQARTPRYNVFVGRYLRPVFKQFKRLKDPMGTRAIVKGLNMKERAELAVLKWGLFDRPVWMKLDGSRFDAHLALPKLLILHSVYNHCCRDPELARALSWMVNNRGRTQGGVFYTSIGRRCSGDYDTGDGNSLDMWFELCETMSYIGIRKWSCAIDGDDVGLIVEESVFKYVSLKMPRAFLRCGQEIKVEGIARRLCDVGQCQSQMLEVKEGEWLFVREWQNVLSGDTSGLKHWNQPTVVPSMLRTIGMGGMAMFVGLPILQEYAAALLRLGGNSKLRWDLIGLDDIAHRFASEGVIDCGNIMPIEITSFVRRSFERSFGVDPAQQIQIEESLRNWNLSSVLPKEYALEWDWTWSDFRHPDNTKCDKN